MKKFYQMSVEERIEFLKSKGIAKEALEKIKLNSLTLETANRMVENAIGTISLPLGILTEFKMNNKQYFVPMAIEEPSVIAAANKASKLAENYEAKSDESVMIGQINIINFSKDAEKNIGKRKNEIEKSGKELSAPMENYGGGWRGFDYYKIKTQKGEQIIFNVKINVSDAMGANSINTIAEKISPLLEEITEGKSLLKIISNLAIYRKAYAKAVWKKEIIEEDLKSKEIKLSADEAIELFLQGYEFGANDHFRLTTNNKGIMNGIDAVALAVGQDWRAVEAGAHMFSAVNKMKPLANYSKDKNGNLVGEIEIPLAVATIGGATATLPHAKPALEILNVKSSRELAMVMACVGLANNFAAIYAMATQGIQAGHMKLHAKNIAVMAGAKTNDDIERVALELAKIKKYDLETARKILGEK